MKILATADLTEEGRARLAALGELVYEPWSETGALLMAEELAENRQAGSDCYTIYSVCLISLYVVSRIINAPFKGTN